MTATLADLSKLARPPSAFAAFQHDRFLSPSRPSGQEFVTLVSPAGIV